MKDLELIEMIKTNPDKGIHILIEKYGGAIFTICRNFLYDCPETDIEEAVSDVFTNFWKRCNTFVLDEKFSLKSYLYTIARNAACDRRRKLKKSSIYSIEEIALDLPADFSLEKEIERMELEAVLHSCLGKMKEPDKSVFLYRYFYGFKISDIAKMLEISGKKVENILYFGKNKLRKDLLERGIDHV